MPTVSGRTSALVALLVGVAAVASANDSQAERASLRGLTDLTVVVEDLSAAAQKTGLKALDLQGDAQQRLRRAGITLKADADAYLYVQITVADPGGTLPLAYVINVSLMQDVTIPRDLQLRTPLQCPTWWVNSLGMASADRVRSAVSDRVHEFVDQFINAFVSVNPKS